MLQHVQQFDRFCGGSVTVWVGIHRGVRTAVGHVTGSLTGIRYRDNILQRHVIPHMNVNAGMFQHANARQHVARVKSFCSAKMTRHYLGLPVRWIWTHQNIYGMHRISVFAGEIHHRRHLRNVLQHCSVSGRTFHNVLNWVMFDCFHTSPLSSCHQGSWWS